MMVEFNGESSEGKLHNIKFFDDALKKHFITLIHLIKLTVIKR